MTTNQVQIRRDTATNLDAATPVSGELGYDTTNKRLVVGDGATAGGIKLPNAPDIQKQAMIYGTVGGTANAITLTNSPVVGAYANGLKLSFKATATNTGATTINVDGLGTKNLYKLSGTSLVALSGNEVISGAIYDITYDGTQFQLTNSAGGGGASDRQAFTSSGTWTKPSGFSSTAMALIEGWGGGGGGGSSGTNGTNGGNTTVGALVTAYGGTGGALGSTNGGAAGGWHSTATAGTQLNDTGSGEGAGGTTSANAKSGYYTGGGGGYNSSTTYNGGKSVYGGGGGGGNGSGTGGTSTYGGNGSTTAGAAAAAPAGGGCGFAGGGCGGGGGSYKQLFIPLSSMGATETITIGAGGAAGGGSSTAGARGEVRITVFG